MPSRQVASVIENSAEFEKNLSGFLNPNKTLAVLLDYDGTLAAITDNPNKTFMSVEIESMLHKLAQKSNVFLAIISGRALKDVKSKIGIKGITYAGNHGLEIELPDGSHHDYELPANMQTSYKLLVKELNEKCSLGVVEDKKLSLTFHYRHTAPELKEELKRTATEIMRSHGFRPNQAHEAIEAKPPVDWNKGEAARFILQTKFGADWSKEVRVIFAGDDTTDEDAMRLLQGMGKSFRISADPEIKTYADFRLPYQELIKDLLNWIGSVYAP